MERYSTKAPENIRLQNGLYVKYDAVFDKKDQADNYGALASGSNVMESPQKGSEGGSQEGKRWRARPLPARGQQ